MKFVIWLLIASISFMPLVRAQNVLDLNAAIAALQPKKLTSVLVMQHDQLLYESYYNGASVETLHDVRSASKTITGLMFGKAIEDGFFRSEQDKVLQAFPRYHKHLYPGEYKSNMTYFDLLTMTGPLECNDFNNMSAGNEERMYLTYDWVEFFFNLPRRGVPPWELATVGKEYDRTFSYCTAGISITAAAIEAKTGMKFSEYTNKALFSKLGIDKVEWPYNQAGITQGGGGLKIRARDLMKIGQLVLKKGRWNDQELLPTDWLSKSLKSYSLAMAEPKATYGITWWHFQYPYQDGVISSFAATGNGGNYLYIVPELGLSAVITATAYNTRYMHKQTQAIFSQVILPAVAQINSAAQ